MTIFTDGGARGNPGPAAVGVVIEDTKGQTIYTLGEPIGDTTNNIAEYTAVLRALEWIRAYPRSLTASEKIQFYLDSELVCRQLRGEYKVKNAGLQGLYYTIQQVGKPFHQQITYTHIPREKNKRADALVNQSLDTGQKLSYNKFDA